MPKISIIVPVYNSEQEIKDCLDSLVEQTEKDLEIIVIDDKSTDHSLEIINTYMPTKSRWYYSIMQNKF